MRLRKVLSMMLLVVMVGMMMTGCKKTATDDVYSNDENISTDATEKNEAAKATTETSSNSDYNYEGSLKLTGFATDFEVAYNDIFAMEPVETTVHHVSSSGEEFESTVKGILLETLLETQGVSQKDFSSIRLIAGDGYAIDVTADILKEKDIILAYEFDGEGLEEKQQPIRAAIDDVRSMFYVSNLSEIAAVSAEATSEEVNVNKVVLIETAVEGLDQTDFTYYDSEDKMVMASDLIAAHVEGTTVNVAFVAADGFEKSEDFGVVNEGYLKITGDDAPLFTGKDLPKGMNVKLVAKMTIAETSFISVNAAMEMLEKKTVDGQEGIPLDQFVEFAGIDGTSFSLVANDGYSSEVQKEELVNGIIYIDDKSGTARTKFTEDMPKNYGVKYLETIIANGAVTVTSEVTVSGDETSSDLALGEWVISFDGLSDGSFDLSSEKAGRKLTLVPLHTEHTKNDEKQLNDWEGYKVLDVLDFLHVESFESLVITASDGFEASLTKEQVDDETILAVVKNGEALTDADNMVQLVQNTEFASTWIKGVAKITVK